jgi:hypothetical protein
MPSKSRDIEVFQDLVIRGRVVDRPSIRRALIGSIASPW